MMRLKQTIVVLGLSLLAGVCWASSLEQSLGLAGEERSAAELVSLCKSTDPDRSAYCNGYIEGATHLWKLQTACASPKRSDQLFCAGGSAAHDLATEVYKSFSGQAAQKEKFRDVMKARLGVCTPDKHHDENYCLGYNAQAESTVADLSVTYHSSASESARELGMGRAVSDFGFIVFGSAEFLAHRPCLPVAMTPEKARKILLAFVRENPEQQVNLPAIMLMARAMFYDFCPGPTPRRLKPHLENCLTWTKVNGKLGVRNSCGKTVVIEFEHKSKLDHRVISGNAFSTDPGLWPQPSPFTACPVGYVSSVPFTDENREDIRSSIYSCVRK